jgi:peroxiredoxin
MDGEQAGAAEGSAPLTPATGPLSGGELTPQPARGAIAPDFSLPNQHGETVTLHSLRGAPVVLVFYPYAFSGVCSREMADLQQALPEITAAGARLVAVSTDTIYALRTFAEQSGLGFDLLSDFWPHGATAKAYGVFDADRGCAVRGSFVLDHEGRVHWSTVGELAAGRDIAEHLHALREIAGR